MPGFFLTFILLCFAAGWGRFLADRIGTTWPMYPPGVGLLVWSVLTVFGIASAMMVVGSGADIDGDATKLNRVLTAAALTRYLSVGVLVLMVPVTVVAWLRPPAEEASQGNA